MKKNETLNYPLADFSRDAPAMTVHLHSTPAGYWAFRLEHTPQIDLADRLFDMLCDLAGFEEKFNAVFDGIPRRGRASPRVSGCSALYLQGQFFPNRESIMNLIENVCLPCWHSAVSRIMENFPPENSWLKAVRKTEKLLNNAPNKSGK